MLSRLARAGTKKHPHAIRKITAAAMVSSSRRRTLTTARLHQTDPDYRRPHCVSIAPAGADPCFPRSGLSTGAKRVRVSGARMKLFLSRHSCLYSFSFAFLCLKFVFRVAILFSVARLTGACYIARALRHPRSSPPTWCSFRLGLSSHGVTRFIVFNSCGWRCEKRSFGRLLLIVGAPFAFLPTSL